ncbi:MAG: ATP-binding protein [Pirellulaceae bacterium]|nr:ATP-binding protein [Pirellulaceae bacterium]
MNKGFIRRTIGGWSLEAKCLLLLGLSLVISIFLAFFVVQAVATRLVVEATRQAARDFAKSFLFGEHVEAFSQNDANRALALQALRKDMLDTDISFELLRLEDRLEFEDLGGSTPKSDIDLKSLRKIAEAIALAESKKQVEKTTEPPLPFPPIGSMENQEAIPKDASSIPASGGATASPLKIPDAVLSPFGPRQSDLFFQEYGPERDFYYYYHPVPFNSGCLDCHPMRSSSGQAISSQMPFRVLKVKMPYAETRQRAIATYAIMIAVGLAMLALSLFFIHWILHRLVIRPLRYLRDVSDEVSKGNLTLRSEIDTDDEFYELSDAFNRMLRHLTETQVELQKVNTVLDSRVDQLAQVNLKLYEANRLKSDFLASMSHELRTPLNSILGFSDVLQGFDTLTEKQKRYAANIQKSGRLLLEMINDILDLAKVEAGKMDVRATRFDLVILIEGQCEVVRALAIDKNIDLQVEIDSTFPIPSDTKPHLDNNPEKNSHSSTSILMVEQDQAKIQQILTNLVSNAIKFTPQGGIITISVGVVDENLFRITIADTGLGIAEHDHEAIFEKFRQVRSVNESDALTREYSGTGLGLSIVRELCRLLGGEITLQSHLGKGSVFRVTLPIQYTPQKPTAAIDAAVANGFTGQDSNEPTKPRFSYP